MVGFSTRPNDKSAWRQNIEASCTEFYDIQPDIPAAQFASFIYEKQIDILFNLNGWTLGQRSDVFALRPSPIQISFMGFCGSTGADYIDYVITDKVATPLETFESGFSEKAIFMPRSYYLNDYANTSKYCLESWD